MKDTLLPFITEFWTLLGITITDISVDVVGDTDLNIRVETPDSALLIGMHGKNIDTFQYLLNRMIENKIEGHIHVHLEINDYMKQKDEKLWRFLDSKIATIKSTGKSIRMPSLSPYERKKAHNYIANKQIVGLKTQSEGENTERTLVLSYTGELVPTPADRRLLPQVNDQHISLISEEGTGI